MERTETESDRLLKIEARAVGAGAASGFVAGIAMGLVFQFGTELMPVLGAFAGRTSVLRGWIVNLVLSVLYGVVFAVLLAYPPIHSFMQSFDLTDHALAGLVYATMIAAFTMGVLPFVFELPWATPAAQAPFPSIPGAAADGGAAAGGGLVPAAVFGVGHLVYGLLLGFLYAVIGETPG